MTTGVNSVRSRMGLVAAVGSLLMTGCGTVPSIDDLSDRKVTRDMGQPGVTIKATFDEVWPEVVEIVEQRGYAELETEQGADEETYRITGEQENQPRDKQFSETVTEKHGRILATTGAGRLVPLELQEQHEWDMSVLDRMGAVAGGSERYRLEHDGVEISVGRTEGGRIDREEFDAVLDAIRSRFESDSA